MANYNKLSIRNNIEQGIPTTNIVDETTQHELDVYVKEAQEASLIAHDALYHGLAEGDPRVIVFTDDKKEPGKYISFKDHDGAPLFGPWNPNNPASDIGIRGANPSFEGIVNPTTVIHADTLAINDFRRNGAPAEVVDAIAAVGKLNEYVVKAIARPHLANVARAFEVDPADYLANFVASEHSRREQILTRAILYHLVATPGQRPVSKDGTPLLIKEHVDKSSWTIDVAQTSPNLQHRVGKKWHDAGTEVTAFRGTADSYLPADHLPATLHRAVVREHTPSKRLSAVGIGRIAMPMFISPIHDDARIVQSNSAETHPTE